MKSRNFFGLLVFVASCAISSGHAQESQSVLPSDPTSVLPQFIKFSGTLREFDQTPHTSSTTVTLSIFKEMTGGTPVWVETQEVQPDSAGRFTVLLGHTHRTGLPRDLFASGEARWVEISSPDLPISDRTELVSVPYALKAGDAETLGGRPLSDFVLAQHPSSDCQSCDGSLQSLPISLPSPVPVSSPRFESTASTGPSFISDAKSGPAFQIQSTDLVPNLNADLLHGLSDAAFAKLSSDNAFTGSQQFLGGFTLPAVNPEQSNSNFLDSAPTDYQSSVLNPSTGALQKQTFRWISNPTVNASGSTSAALSLLYGANGSTPSSTGLSLNPDGTINFVATQQFPSAGIVAAVNGTSNSNDPSISPIVYSAGYKWQQQPQASSNGQQGIQIGWNSIPLSPCPQGVNGTDAWHYLLISGSGTPEIVLISGGTCTSGAKSGTIEFTAAYAHPQGYSIGSATAGLQEAVNVAILPNSSGQSSRTVTINPGEYVLQARLSIRASGIQISGYGATLTCTMQDTCVMLGDPSDTNAFLRITLQGISVRPGVQSGTFSAIEDNANGSQLVSIAPAQGTNQAFTFGHIIQVDNDQAASMDRIDTAGTATIRCDSQFCGSVIYAPGPFAINAAVGWLTNSNISPQCKANGVDWQSGNTLQIEDTVIQGYAQFGVRAGTARGGYGNLSMKNVYEEVGNCSNPQGNLGHAGVIAQGGGVSISGGEGPAGELPCFSTSCSGNLTRYYIVAENTAYGVSNPLGAGVTPMSDTSTTVSWAAIPGATSYDLLAEDGVVAWYAGDSPSGTGSFAVAINVPQSVCTNGVCSFVDTHAPRMNYSIHTPTYFPLLTYWPGTIVLTSSGDTGSQYGPSVLQDDVAPNGIVAEQGVVRAAVLAQSCQVGSGASAIWEECQTSTAPPSDLYQQQATIMVAKPNADGGLDTNLKGRLNFATLGSGPSHIITLSDSNFQKTIATASNRPTNDPNDAFIGYDQGDGDPTHIGISFGAPLSISSYIGNNGDGTNWLERLTPSMKTSRVPLQTTAVAFSTLPLCNPGTEGAMRAVLDSTTVDWGTTVAGGGGGHILAYCDGSVWTVLGR